ncbi:MAG TPA: heparinase II/III family protein [Xanthobacteraceae bacterium]|nr:heparinase II/III family protein [Xanthobacteraceae bacterium]
MARVAIAERGKLRATSLRRGVHRFVGRVKSLVTVLTTLPGRADHLVIAPQDLRTADPTRAAEIYGGRFAFAGKVVVCDGRSPFDVIEPSEEWAEALLSFGWLRHLRAEDTFIARKNAYSLVDEWMSMQRSYRGVAWQPDVLSRRIISWLSQAPLILDAADERFYRRFIRSLTRQVQFLHSTARDAQAGVPRLQAQIALTYASLCIASQLRNLNKVARRLVVELDRQVLPDGGHLSRNPAAVIELLLDLLPLTQAFAARNLVPPPALLNAVDRMMPMLRFFRHGDGSFALFNGMGPTPPDLVATLIAYDDTRGTPVHNAVHSGYQRIEAGAAVVLMDTGKSPPVGMSRDAHAGCLSFELSARAQRIVVNCGMPATGRENWRDHARSTAAHSTVTFNDTSSCRFLETGSYRRQAGVPITAGPTRVKIERLTAEDGATILRASHDGYLRFSVIHQRTIALATDGTRLDGEDLFLSSKGETLPAKVPDAFALRFHLHPAVRATRLSDGHGAMLVLPGRELWNFHAYEDVVEIEDSAFLGGPDGPRRSQQIVIRGHARQTPRLRWYFEHAPTAARARASTRGQEPELPL